jgi:tRNA(Ile)-lysidine synthetase-like protein
MAEFKDYFLSRPHIWFNASVDDDKYICQTYGHLLLNVENNEIKDLIEKILILDQLSRHMRRMKYIDDTLSFDEKARDIVYQNMDDLEKYSPIERCFFLMPLRHTFDAYILEYEVLPLVRKWRESDDLPEYQRFYYATLNSLADVKKGEFPVLLRRDELDPMVFDPASIKGVDKLGNVNHKVYTEHQNIIVSLSGGVDSMLCLKLFHQLKLKNNINLIAVHINYDNRETADEEEELCRHYCLKLGIPLCVRKITEIHRDRSHDRDFYEKVTHKIRFNTYKQFPGYAVVLGHNKDDSLENIFSNIKKNKHFDNLTGMNDESVEDGVTLIRPLLKMNKTKIIELAQEHCIPFVYDSTPKWSERGKMRDILIPSIQSFDKNILEGLLTLSEQYQEIYQMAKDSIDDVKINFEEKRAMIENRDYRGMYYWKSILKRITIHFNIPMISNKSIQHFLEVRKPTIKIELSKYLYIIDNTCFLTT